MIQIITTYARKHVFESARFYYGMLVLLTGYFLFNRFLQKLLFVYLDLKWSGFKITEGILFALAYGVILISAWYLRNKIPRFVFWCWGGIVLIFLVNEFRFAWGSPDYSLIESFTKSQGYYTAKFTMPILFLGVWSVLKNINSFGKIFIHRLQQFLTINAVFIILGALLGITVFESYPLTGRWGYSGIFEHNSINIIFYGITLMLMLLKLKKQRSIIFLFALCLLLSGQKSGLLYLGLILFIIIVNNIYIRWTLGVLSIIMIITTSFWLPLMISYSTFWRNVYHKHGIFGVIFSTRNENLINIYSSFGEQHKFLDWVFGFPIRFPERVEMMIFDISFFYGLFGLFLSCFFYWKWIPNWPWTIPLAVACFAGGVNEAPLAMLFYGVAVLLMKND